MKIVIHDVTPFSFAAPCCPFYPEYRGGAFICNIGIYVSMKIHSTTCLTIMVHPCLYFRTVHVVIFILFKPTHALFLKHTHIHI